MNRSVQSLLAIAGIAAATHAAAQVTFFEREDFRGRSFTADRQIGNFERWGFNDRASSAIVDGGQWEVCEDVRFSGRCVMLSPGRYDSLRTMGLNNRVSSVRAVDSQTGYDAPRGAYDTRDRDYRRRQGERLFEANVTSVRAVVDRPEQRCWMEREQVQGREGPNVPGAVVGAVIGGILGHQIGGGRGQDIATAGGAVGGAALGANVGRGGGGYAQDVQRCENVRGDVRPNYYDVTYEFRGQQHQVQMTEPPGQTILVNREGEPRL